jgi:hypothetical protein
MKRVHVRLARLAAACVVATTSLVALNATPALADELNTYVYGAGGSPYLGYGKWVSATSGAQENGYMVVGDEYCDGDNGIIAALYVVRSGEWTRVNLVSVRGCNSTNRNDMKATVPSYREQVRFRVCKLLPDGTWKDCKDSYGNNNY